MIPKYNPGSMSSGNLLDPFFELAEGLFSIFEKFGLIILFCVGAMIILPIIAGLINALGPNADPDIVKTIFGVALEFIKKNPLIDFFAIICGTVAYWLFQR